jgi:hypothetical protein
MKMIVPLLCMGAALAATGCGQETRWFIDQPKNLAKETIQNDVWHWYDMDALRPIAIQRVEWNTKPPFGNKRWGYFIYFQGRLKDSDLVQSIKQEAKRWEEYPGLPNWASHVPEWWTPEIVIPPELSAKIAGVEEFAFAKIAGDDLFVFCLKRPLDDAVLHESQ